MVESPAGQSKKIRRDETIFYFFVFLCFSHWIFNLESERIPCTLLLAATSNESETLDSSNTDKFCLFLIEPCTHTRSRSSYYFFQTKKSSLSHKYFKSKRFDRYENVIFVTTTILIVISSFKMDFQIQNFWPDHFTNRWSFVLKNV